MQCNCNSLALAICKQFAADRTRTSRQYRRIRRSKPRRRLSGAFGARRFALRAIIASHSSRNVVPASFEQQPRSSPDPLAPNSTAIFNSRYASLLFGPLSRLRGHSDNSAVGPCDGKHVIRLNKLSNAENAIDRMRVRERESCVCEGERGERVEREFAHSHTRTRQAFGAKEID